MTLLTRRLLNLEEGLSTTHRDAASCGVIKVYYMYAAGKKNWVYIHSSYQHRSLKDVVLGEDGGVHASCLIFITGVVVVVTMLQSYWKQVFSSSILTCRNLFGQFFNSQPERGKTLNFPLKAKQFDRKFRPKQERSNVSEDTLGDKTNTVPSPAEREHAHDRAWTPNFTQHDKQSD